MTHAGRCTLRRVLPPRRLGTGGRRSAGRRRRRLSRWTRDFPPSRRHPRRRARGRTASPRVSALRAAPRRPQCAPAPPAPGRRDDSRLPSSAVVVGLLGRVSPLRVDTLPRPASLRSAPAGAGVAGGAGAPCGRPAWGASPPLADRRQGRLPRLGSRIGGGAPRPRWRSGTRTGRPRPASLRSAAPGLPWWSTPTPPGGGLSSSPCRLSAATPSLGLPAGGGGGAAEISGMVPPNQRESVLRMIRRMSEARR